MLDVAREGRKVTQEVVRSGVEVLEHDGVEARQMLAEELVDGEWNQCEVFLGRADVVGVRSENEERDHVDGGVGLEPHAKGAHVVGRSAGDVQDSNAIARNVERQKTPIVIWDRVPVGRLDGHFDDTGAGAIERDGELDRGGAMLEVGNARREQRGGSPLDELARAHREILAGEPSVAADLDRERQRLMRDRGARGPNAADARVRR